MAGTPAKHKNTFTSYVNCTQESNGKEDAVYKPKAKFINGELQVCNCFAQMYPPTAKITDNDFGVYGLLVVTNFKLSFLPSNPVEEHHQMTYQENLFLGRNDVTLDNIDALYQIVDKKRKRLYPQQQASSRIEALYVLCKNFRLLKFSFKFTTKDQGKNIASALAKFAFPYSNDLSFALRYRENYYNPLKTTVTMFNNKNDWARELIRCGATEWRVLSSETIDCCNALQLPLYFVIPKCISNEKFIESSSAFYDSRTAFWVYSYGNASLVRMAELRANVTDTSIENVTLELIRKCDPAKKSLKIMNLSELLPNIHDVQRGYIKFRELCTPDSPQQFLLQESKYYTLLDKSCWLLYISLCLKFSNEAAESLRDGTTVVLRENNARDLCCIISSLVQIILDPYFRTINGFQSLIQKEWIALEHPFADRLGHVIKPDSTDEQSPLLLLFLDCVWQLLQQYPSEFEFSQTYLTTIWDSAFQPIFDTFQYNTQRDRHQSIKELKLILRPVWDWSEQFAEKDKIFFTNPFYAKKNDNCRKSIAIPPNAILLPGLQKAGSRFTFEPGQLNHHHHHYQQSTIPKDRYLEPKTEIYDLDIWQQCYHRWIPILEIKNGGFPQIDLFHRLILSNISKLQRAIETGDYDDLPEDMLPPNMRTRKLSVTTTETEDNIDTITTTTATKTATPTTNISDVDKSKSNELITPTNSPSRQMPMINSFFPFSANICDSSQLNDILTSSNEILTEGSIIDRLSIAQLPD